MGRGGGGLSGVNFRRDDSACCDHHREGKENSGEEPPERWAPGQSQGKLAVTKEAKRESEKEGE